ncbi:hypothetical protein D3C73_1479270 [compost metagenome]
MVACPDNSTVPNRYWRIFNNGHVNIVTQLGTLIHRSSDFPQRRGPGSQAHILECRNLRQRQLQCIHIAAVGTAEGNASNQPFQVINLFEGSAQIFTYDKLVI